jgi:small subunit ribosomal protein S7
MPRRREVPVRTVLPDPKYNSVLVAKFIRSVMRDGKKSTAEQLLYDAFDIIKAKSSEPPLKVFEKALDNVKPMSEVKSRRVGGSTYQVPTEVRPARRQALGIRWMIDFARKRGDVAWPRGWPVKFSMLPTIEGGQRKSGKIRTAWPRQIKPLPTFGGKRLDVDGLSIPSNLDDISFRYTWQPLPYKF